MTTSNDLRKAAQYLGLCVLAIPLGVSCAEPQRSEGGEQARSVVSELAYSEWPGATIVALDSVQIGSNASVRGEVQVVRAVANAARSELSLLSGATIQGNVQADTVTLALGSTVQGDASYNGVSGTGTITGTQSTPLAIPLPTTVPAAPAVTIGADNITVPGGTVRVLTAGNYNVVTINASARVQLTGGLYQVRRIAGSAQSRVECMAACELRVLENAVFQANTGFGPAPTSSVGISDVQLIVLGGNTPFDQNPAALQFGASAVVSGYIYVPNGAFRVAGSVGGKVVARDVIITSGTVDGYNIPRIVESPESQEIRERQPATFDVAAEGHELSYQWLRNDQPIDGAVGASYTISALALTDDGAKFSVRVSNRAGSVTSGVAVLKVIPCESSDSSCDGVDQDCSGAADEDYAQTVTHCGVGACAASGNLGCIGGAEKDDCTPGTPVETDAICDGKDEDCDGSTDEEYPSAGTSCGVGACRRTGIRQCVDGAAMDTCVPGAPAETDASCDGVDDDCDGEIDEDYVSVDTNCGAGGCARAGVTSCVDGVVQDSCQPGAPDPADERCDGIDEDCSGDTDEDYVPVGTHCGAGICRASGQTSCGAGEVVDSCRPGTPGPEDVECDGIDTDCDGQTDEDYAPVATQCGIGACQRTSSTACEGGGVVDGCVPGTPAEDDVSCNGVDDDCDGSIDEDYVPRATSCGVGVCAGAGATACSNGGIIDGCVAGTPSDGDTTCDALDNDCDGATDEDYVPEPTTCGTGACSAAGLTSCSAGTVLDNCNPGSPAALDATCDGVDDDCDGAVDEDYVSVSTACGVGACQANGTTTCAAGRVVGSCTPGTPGAADIVCNGMDDDCDGSVDEDYVVQSTRCGVGACRASGSIACEGGTLVAHCEVGDAAPNDVLCDGIDDDCDGSVDEDYEPESVSCGVGACLSIGTTACIGGVVEEHCEAAIPASNDATCNGVDDDCDGQTDEGFAPVCDGATVAICVQGALQVSACGDGDPCNGEETCGIGVCEPGIPPVVDDSNPCTSDSCEPLAGIVHGFYAPGTECGAGLLCDGLGSCIGTPAITQRTQALAVDVRYPISLRVGVRDGVMSYQFSSWDRAGAVQAQPLSGGYGPLRVPPVTAPWFSYTLQPLRIEIGSFSVTVNPATMKIPALKTLYVHVLLGRRGAGSVEVIPVGVGG